MNIRELGRFVLRHPLRKANPLHFPGTIDSSQSLAVHMISEAPDFDLSPSDLDTCMWAVRENTLVLFDVASADVRDLEHKWGHYNLHTRVGKPCETMWGVLDYLDDYRR